MIEPLRLEDIEYDIEWHKFTPRTSVFVPCKDITAAKEVVTKYFTDYALPHVIRDVVEDGVQGLRIWHFKV